MTLLSRLGFKPQKRENIVAPLKIKSSDISIVIPVKNNQRGVDLFLTELLKTHKSSLYPREIVIVDNNSSPKITVSPHLYNDKFSVILLICSRNGPACARNIGLQSAKGDWILFADSDCIPSESFIQGYLDAINGSVGYAGYVKSYGNGFLSRYYDSQEILIPLKVVEDGESIRPECLITANALVWKKALEKVGGFNESISIAAGEDIDLSFRLLEIGRLSYALQSVVYHDYNDGLIGFMKRFIRYGQGNKIINKLYNIDVFPRLFRANQPNFINKVLSKIQYICLLGGYVTK